MDTADVPQWYITTPVPASGGKFEEPWMFGEGRLLPDPGPIKAPVRNQGVRRTFMFAGIERVPIVSEAVANVFRRLAPDDVQLFPVTVEGESAPFFIVNAVKAADCIDEANCEEVHRYDQDDPYPERRGAYRWIYGLRVDPAKTDGARVFRPKRFTTALIVSEDIKDALESVGSLGVSFERVTGSSAQEESRET
ncbi:imm11 family protein [Myxococcus sp. RHSTA-1-4]|uniref:imm11 family protein n=1 Tax=Myxococcus sp. RHSTA-1-4 TaxID=2874601 RepID=UPI001CC1237D